MSWRRFFIFQRERFSQFLRNPDPETMTKTLITFHLCGYYANQIVPDVMEKYFTANEKNTIKDQNYYTVISSSVNHKEFTPMFLNSMALWIVSKPLAYVIGGSGIFSAYFFGTIFNFMGKSYECKNQGTIKEIPDIRGASAAVSAVFMYFILLNPWEPVFFPVVPPVLLGALLLFFVSKKDDHKYLYGIAGGSFCYFLKFLIR